LRFWDTSSIIPLIVNEPTSDLTDGIFEQDQEIVVWWETEVECVHGLSEAFRSRRFGNVEVEQSLNRLADLVGGWSEIQPTDQVRVRAERLLFAHILKSADAMQLASALLWCGDDPRAAEFVCQDRQLRTAARREGFTVLPSSEQLGKPF
jgi:uncharacterized protein